jgi:hypothetical protein
MAPTTRAAEARRDTIGPGRGAIFAVVRERFLIDP